MELKDLIFTLDLVSIKWKFRGEEKETNVYWDPSFAQPHHLFKSSQQPTEEDFIILSLQRKELYLWGPKEQD